MEDPLQLPNQHRLILELMAPNLYPLALEQVDLLLQNLQGLLMEPKIHLVLRLEEGGLEQEVLLLQNPLGLLLEPKILLVRIWEEEGLSLLNQLQQVLEARLLLQGLVLEQEIVLVVRGQTIILGLANLIQILAQVLSFLILEDQDHLLERQEELEYLEQELEF